MNLWTIYGLPGSSVYGVSQAGILEWLAISFSRGTFDWGTEPVSPVLQAVSCVAGWFFTDWATRKVPFTNILKGNTWKTNNIFRISESSLISTLPLLLWSRSGDIIDNYESLILSNQGEFSAFFYFLPLITVL